MGRYYILEGSRSFEIYIYIVDIGIIINISEHLNTFKGNFDSYFSSEVKNYQQINWISNTFQEQVMTSGLSNKSRRTINRNFWKQFTKNEF